MCPTGGWTRMRYAARRMRDLTDRALDTASVLGAGYADVRVVRRRDESIDIKTGRVEGVASGESEGFGVRVLVDGAWGFASSLSSPSTRPIGSPLRQCASPGLRPPPCASRRSSMTDHRRTARFETPVEEDPFASRSTGRSPTCSPRMSARRRSRGSSSPSRCTTRSASGRRSPRRTAARPSR